ncbi:Ger(x)C family spore germination protein [Alkalihalobacillus sp. 1P02AB]|uniref:Ger(x)C family spore germination protein n=1 Tax=Alkalihalobacillus sp. 1P02AB TaxID=3132260 RepID=UPI0039A5538F
MKRTLLFLFLTVFLLASLSACWNRREVTDLAIAVSLGIDKSDEGHFIVTVQVLNPNEVAAVEGGGGYDSPVTTYSASGEMLFEALRKLTKQVPRSIYLAHIRMIVFGEKYAREGIYDSLDFLSRDHEMRTDFYIVVAKDKSANEVLSTLTSIEKIPADKLLYSLESSSENWAVSRKVQMNQLIDEILITGMDPVLTGITTLKESSKGDTFDNVQTVNPEVTLMYTGLAVFRQNQLIGWLTEDESKGFNYIKGDVQSTVVVTECGNGQAGIEMINMDSTIKTSVEGSKPAIFITIEGKGKLAEINCKLDVQKPNTINELEKQTNKQIESDIRDVIFKAQKEFSSDFLGFGHQLYKDFPDEWKKYKGSWETEFAHVDVEVKSNIKVREVGSISNPFLYENEEG